jgi:hypothetical protein
MSSAFHHDEIFFRTEFKFALQLARPRQIAHRVDVFHGQFVARRELVFFKQAEHIAVDLVTRRCRGGGEKDIDRDRRRQILQHAERLFAQPVFLRG